MRKVMAMEEVVVVIGLVVQETRFFASADYRDIESVCGMGGGARLDG